MLDARNGASPPAVFGELARYGRVRTALPDTEEPSGYYHLWPGDERCVDCEKLAKGFGDNTAAVLANQLLTRDEVRCSECLDAFRANDPGAIESDSKSD